MLIYQFQKSIKQNNKINKNTSKSWRYIQLANDTFHFELYIQGKKQTQPYIENLIKLYVHKMTYYKMCYKIFIIVIILYSKKRNKKKLNNRYYKN